MTIEFSNIDVSKPDLKQLEEPDAVLVLDDALTVVIDFPLSNAAEFVTTSEKVGAGFSKKQIVQLIIGYYVQIYKEEEETATVKARRVSDVFTNRSETDGHYGVYGYELSELAIAGFSIRRDQGYPIVTPIMYT